MADPRVPHLPDEGLKIPTQHPVAAHRGISFTSTLRDIYQKGVPEKEHVRKYALDRMSGYMSDKMSNRMPAYISDRIAR